MPKPLTEREETLISYLEQFLDMTEGLLPEDISVAHTLSDQYDLVDFWHEARGRLNVILQMAEKPK